MTKREFMEWIPVALTGTAYEKYIHSLYLCSAAASLVADCGKNRIKVHMEGYPCIKQGRRTLYAKPDVYAMLKDREQMA